MIYFLVILMIVIVAIFFIPIRFDIYTNLKGKSVYSCCNSNEKNKVKISLKILGFIPIYVYDKQKKEQKGKANKVTIGKIFKAIKNATAEEEFKITNFTKKILSWCRKVKFKKLVLVAGFNTNDYVKNAYINASLNSIICMIINKNEDRFNFNKLYYQVGISDYNYYLTVDSIITFSLFRNIDVFITIIKFIFNLKKENNKGVENDINSNSYLKDLKIGE